MHLLFVCNSLTAARRSFSTSRHLSRPLTLTARLVQEQIAMQLGSLGISYAQADVLVRLWRREGHMTQTQLIQSLAVSRASGTLLLKQLERRGLIERQPDRVDGRRLRVRLTPAGRDLEQPVLLVFERVEAVVREPLDPADVETMFRVLRAVQEQMQRQRGR